MRKELELIEKIDCYLSKTMSPDEVAAFEQEMAKDAALRAAVQEQYITMQGLFRVKARQQVLRAGRQYHGKKMWTRIGFSAAIMVAVVGAVLYFAKSNHTANTTTDAYSGNTLPAVNETGKAQWATADSVLPAQVFTIAAASDTVVETAGGIVFSIPAGAFVDEAGKAVSGTVSVCIKEALDAQSIITAGLSTTADGKLLETGGMFFIDARQGNSILKINPALPVYAQVTSSAPKEGMQLFSGQRMPGGGINWVTPKPLPNDLIAVDINGLDFYPPGYMDVLKKHGYPTGDRRFTDSVYYSVTSTVSDQTSVERAYRDNGQGLADSTTNKSDTSRLATDVCGINPAKIEAIRKPKFANTLLATHEFEQRIKVIHATNNPKVLDLYVSHLDKNLYELDSMAAEIQSSRTKDFQQFAALHCGKVKGGLKQLDKLRGYYEMQTEILTEAIAQAERRAKLEQQRIEDAVVEKHGTHAQQDNSRVAQNFSKELQMNLDSAYHQLGYTRKPMNAINPGVGTLLVISSVGWNNLDRYVVESTINRSNLNYTEPSTGKKVVIMYSPISVTVTDAKNYDRLLVYLLPDKLSSFIKMNDSNSVYTEKLNGFMKYELVCIGIKGNQQSILCITDAAPKHYNDLVLKTVNANEAVQLFQQLWPGEPAMMSKEIEYAIWDVQEEHRQQLQQQWILLYNELTHLIYPCAVSELGIMDTTKKTEIKKTDK